MELLAVGGALSVAGNLIQFAETFAKIVHRIHSYHKRLDYVPKIVRDIEARSALLRSGLQRAAELASRGSVKYSESEREALKKTIDACTEIIEKEALPLLDKILPTLDDSKLKSAVRAVSSLRREEDLEKTWARIERYDQQLANFSVLAGSAMIKEELQPLFEYPKRAVQYYVERSQEGSPLIQLLSDHAATQDPAVTVLLGMGGAGKTQLALRYCRKLRESCRAVVWIDATSDKSVVLSFQSIARTCGINLANSMSSASEEALEQMIRAVCQHIEALKPWAMIFDSYDRVNEFRGLGRFASLRDFWPHAGGQVVITSRDKQCERLGTAVFEIGRLSSAEAIELLRAQVKAEDAEALELVEKLGHLALAIDQAASYIRSQRLTLEQFTDRYEKQKSRVLSKVPATNDWEYRKNEQSVSVFTTWELSLTALSGNSQEQEQKIHFLSTCSFLGAFIHETILEKGMTGVLAAMFQDDDQKWDAIAFDEFIAELRDVSLLENFDRDDAGRIFFSYHPLICEWIKLRLPPLKREEHAIEAAYISRRNMPQDILKSSEGKTVEELESIAGYVSTCVVNCREFLKHQVLGVGDLESLGRKFYRFLAHYLMPELADSMCRHILAWRRRHQAPWARGDLIAGIALATSIKRTSPQESVVLSEELYTAARQTHGEDAEITLRCLTSLGNSYDNAGVLDKAEKIFREVCDRQHRTNVPIKLWFCSALGGLSSVLSKRAYLKEAIRYAEDAKEKTLNLYGPDHACTLDAEAMVLATCGDADEADAPPDILERGRHCVEQHERRVGSVHALAFNIKMLLAHLYSRRGQFDNANQLLQDAVISAKSASHPFQAHLYRELGAIALHAGQSETANQYSAMAVAAYEQFQYHLSSEHYVRACIWVSRHLDSQGKGQEALDMWKRILEAREARKDTNLVTGEIIYWELYILLGKRVLTDHPAWKSLAREHLCTALGFSKSLRQQNFSVIQRLQNAATGFWAFQEEELSINNSGDLLRAWEQQPQFKIAVADIGDAAEVPFPGIFASICNKIAETTFPADVRYVLLGNTCLFHGDHENAQIAYENMFRRDLYRAKQPQPWIVCGLCKKNVTEVVHACIDCVGDTCFDAKCLASRGEICTDHSFLPVPRPEWVDFEDGMVGPSISKSDWLKAMKAKYATAELPASELWAQADEMF